MVACRDCKEGAVTIKSFFKAYSIEKNGVQWCYSTQSTKVPTGLVFCAWNVARGKVPNSMSASTKALATGKY